MPEVHWNFEIVRSYRGFGLISKSLSDGSESVRIVYIQLILGIWCGPLSKHPLPHSVTCLAKITNSIFAKIDFFSSKRRVFLNFF